MRNGVRLWGCWLAMENAGGYRVHSHIHPHFHRARAVLGELQDAQYATRLEKNAHEEEVRLRRVEKEDERLAQELMEVRLCG